MQSANGIQKVAPVAWTRFAVIAVAVATFSSLLIVGSYRRLSHTWDEPTHVAAGMEWLQLHRYTKQTENPPFSRIPLALIPYLSGMRIKNDNSTALASGVAMFYGSGDYIDNVTKARLANLLFFWLLLTMTWVLSGGRKNPMVAVVATATAATVPAIVAHSGLATTDVPFVAAFLLAVWRWKTLLEHPSPMNAAWWGSASDFHSQRNSARSRSFRLSQERCSLVIGGRDVWPTSGDRRRGSLGTRHRCNRLRRHDLGELRIPSGDHRRVAKNIRALRDDGDDRLGRSHSTCSTSCQRISAWATVPAGSHEGRPFELHVGTNQSARVLALLPGHVDGQDADCDDRLLLWASRSPCGGVISPSSSVMHLARWACCSSRRPARSTSDPAHSGDLSAAVYRCCLRVSWASRQVRNPDRASSGCRWSVLSLQMTVLAARVPRQLAYFNVIASGRTGLLRERSDFDWGQDVIAMEAYFRGIPCRNCIWCPTAPRVCRHDLPALKPLPVGLEVNGWIAVFERPYQLNQGRTSRDICQPPSPANTVAVPKGWLDWLHQRRPEAVIGSACSYFMSPTGTR